MNLSAPKNTTFYLAMVVGVLGVLGTFIQLSAISDFAPWLVIIGFVILALGVMLENF
ncbi:MAG TPA: hypothetical protein VMN57_02200 [Anaerolineales bacterium]|nr:hypothetical protein [Anaerolineales bacterium]